MNSKLPPFYMPEHVTVCNVLCDVYLDGACTCLRSTMRLHYGRFMRSMWSKIGLKSGVLHARMCVREAQQSAGAAVAFYT